jgi:hypothetical protein
MTKSPVALAKAALRTAALLAYSHRFSPKRFTQHQLFAVPVLRQLGALDATGLETR